MADATERLKVDLRDSARKHGPIINTIKTILLRQESRMLQDRSKFHLLSLANNLVVSGVCLETESMESPKHLVVEDHIPLKLLYFLVGIPPQNIPQISANPRQDSGRRLGCPWMPYLTSDNGVGLGGNPHQKDSNEKSCLWPSGAIT